MHWICNLLLYNTTLLKHVFPSNRQGLSRVRDGLLIAEADLNLIQQIKDKWNFQVIKTRKDVSACYISLLVVVGVKAKQIKLCESMHSSLY